jgi:hypothetical protein
MGNYQEELNAHISRVIDGITGNLPAPKAVATSDEIDLAHSEGFGLGWNKAIEEVLSFISELEDRNISLGRPENHDLRTLRNKIREASDK